ncbi:MAG: amidase [Kofleriaceae bacterium]
MSDDAFSSIAELGAKLRARTLTAVQLAELYLARIERLQPKLNAFITVTADLARSEAKRADAELAGGRDRGPLHGIPYGLKDLVDTAGIPTTWGCKATVNRIPERDGAVVAKLREAGAVLLGKLSMTELANALGNVYTSDNHNGPCRNPWDVTRWAGGSSSGAGSAVAAGMCAFAIGSETWGSIDCPAAYCGITGFRPTFGTIDATGALLICPTLDKLGPLARSAADAAVVLTAVAGSPIEPAPQRPLRVGVATPPSGPPGYARAFADVIAALSGSVQLAGVVLPDRPVVATTAVILYAEIFGALAGFIQSGGVERLYDREPWDTKWAAYISLGFRGDDYVKAAYVRAAIQRDYRALFEHHDVILTGGRPVIASVIDHPETEAVDAGNTDVINAVGNLIGLPALTAPIGFSERMPISLHAVAAPYEDAKLLAFGELVQRQTRHHLQRPPVD